MEYFPAFTVYVCTLLELEYMTMKVMEERKKEWGGAHIVHSLKTERQNCYEDTKVIYFSVL